MPETALSEADEPIVSRSYRFPLRLAGLDIGSNAIRFFAAEFADHHRFKEITNHKFPVRLGHDAFTAGVLLPPTVEAVTDCVRTFRDNIADLRVVAYRAIATSALRESRNAAEVIERVRLDTGIVLETITGEEEARLAWIAVRARIPLGSGTWLLADLGGGSLELSAVTDDGIVATESTKVGAVRILELSVQVR